MSVSANISTLQSIFTNWVGSAHGAGVDTACYRETHIAKVCPLGFEYKLGTCWAECPLEYPVECGMQCIRQNDDCTLEMLSKFSSVAQAALSVATFGAYEAFSKMAKGVQTAFRCGKEIANLVKALSKYARTVLVSDPQTTTEELTTILYQTDNVVFDLPITIMSCLGLKVSAELKFTDRVTNTIELFVKEVVTHREAITSGWHIFTSFMKNISLDDAFDSLDETTITSLQSALASDSTCGDDMKHLTDRVWMTVAYLRKQNPRVSEDEIRVILSKSNLMHHEIPLATNNCMKQFIEESDEATAYTTRDTLRKTFGGIVDDLISSGTSDNGTYLSAEEYSYTISNKVLMLAAVWDPSNFIGEVDDGSASDALGLRTVGKAFNNSAGTWTKKGDGSVTVVFHSEDTEDVKVNVMSGGNQIDKVKVKAGTNVTWVSNTTVLGGKTLYLDRWRDGFLGIPGTGGGSLLLWIPRSDQGGKLMLTSKLNVS
ncbi:uncharacterized protein PITG_03182 [Phytophthora infestans T30-4]|uniref:Jacalin-type lectin domain-containing protein n=1 Tax=Phytophthora infestans (strain T30-4) TaxID=403677 RepID=D0MZK6_PHYIT|nr:uncharacterized protein PITG_03182 [Phytophthora infestans T30-4]EEY65669.1 conserved hypothetical protein [Phytophthora infestans T30-4]|eukprot:XP_002906268.1 conserved hypothetical protein [Phytophthora infestans T30-4]